MLRLLPAGAGQRVSREIAGAIVDAWQLETGDAVGIPIQIRLSGDHIETLHKLAENVKGMLRAIPAATGFATTGAKTGSTSSWPSTRTARAWPASPMPM